MSTKKALTVFVVIVLLFVSISFTDATWTIFGIIGSLAIGLGLSLKLDELIIIYLPFSFDIFVPQTINLNASDIVLLPLLLLLWITKSKTIYENKLLKSSTIWFLLFSIAIWLPLLLAISADQIISSNFIAYMKLLVGFIYGLAGIWIFASSNFDTRSDLVKIWSYVALVIAAGSVIAFLANIVGINSQFMYSATRIKGTFENPNTFALYLLVSLGIQMFTMINRPTTKLLLFSSIITAAIALANSRAGQISFVAMMAFVILVSFFSYKKRLRIKSIFFLILPIVYFGLVPGILSFLNLLKNFINPSMLSSWSPSTEQNTVSIQPSYGLQPNDGLPQISPFPQSTTQALNDLALQREPIEGDLRFLLWKAAIKLWQSSPLNGVGLGNFPTESKAYTGVNYVAHNSFLSLLAETGLIGLIFFLIPVLYLFVLLLTNRNNFISIALLSSLVAMAIMMSANNLENVRFVWFLIGASLAWARLKTDYKKASLLEYRKIE